jgi:hypothetical protein
MLTFSIFWAIITIFFFFTAYRQYKMSRKGIKIKDLDLGFSDLNEAYNNLREGIIEADKSSHKIAFFSFLFAGIAALISFAASLNEVWYINILI